MTIGNSVTYIGRSAFSGCSSLTSIYATCGDLDRIKQLLNNDSRVKYKPLPYTISTTAQNGNVTKPQNICEALELTASPDYGYHFTQWNDGNTDNPRIIELTQDTSFTAEFAANITGKCGDDLQWSLADSILTITGISNMWDEQPWVVSREAIKQVIFPQGITSIGSGAFAGCNSLPSITIPENVASIGNNAFSNCDNITTVVWNATNCSSCSFGSQVTTFTFGENVEVIPASLCSGMNRLTEITIPNSVKSIGNNAFQNCAGLTSMVVPDGVITIGSGIFSGCTGLTSLTIPSSATNNQTTIAQNTINLKIANAPASFFDVQESSWANCPKYLEQVTVNSDELNDNMVSVIGRSYKTLKELDFSGISNTVFADEAVKDYYNMTSLVLPANTEHIGYMAVAECVKLQEINIPASVTEIEDRAFENCRSLKSITFGESSNPAPGRSKALAASTSVLQRIGNWAFYNCHELQNLTIPEGVTEIGDGAFYGCVYLEDLSLPSSVQSIGDNTFALCAKLQKIVVNAVVPPSIQAKTFYDVQRQIPVYVPDECVTAYKNDAQWSEFNIQGISNMPMGINQITNDQSQMTTKLLRNGQIFILRGDKTYTLTGQEVK